MLEINKVYHDDCFNIIELLADESLDLVIVNPPYGDNAGYGRQGKEILNNEDETINYKFLDAIFPKLKTDKSLYLFTNHKFAYQIKEHAVAMGYGYRMQCIMVKNNIGMGYGFRNQYEICLVFEKGKAKYNLKDFSNVWKMKHVQHDDDTHPHQKEYDIIRKIIRHSSEPGELVFDGFMGSFATAKACFKESRNFIGSELDEKWHKAGTRDLDGLRSQTALF